MTESDYHTKGPRIDTNMHLSESHEAKPLETSIPDANTAAAELNQGPKNTRLQDIGESVGRFFMQAAGVGGMVLGGTVYVALCPLTIPLSIIGSKIGKAIGRSAASEKDKTSQENAKELGSKIGLGIGSFGTIPLCVAAYDLFESANKRTPQEELAKIKKDYTAIEKECDAAKKEYENIKASAVKSNENHAPFYSPNMTKEPKLINKDTSKAYEKWVMLDEKRKVLERKIATLEKKPIP